MMGIILTAAGQHTESFWKSRLLHPETGERGSILLVSLVMLLVMTVAGLTAVKMATLEEKMSGNYQDQQMAFYAAEAALKRRKILLPIMNWPYQALA